jgi:hypothetical protein
LFDVETGRPRRRTAVALSVWACVRLFNADPTCVQGDGWSVDRRILRGRQRLDRFAAARTEREENPDAHGWPAHAPTLRDRGALRNVASVRAMLPDMCGRYKLSAKHDSVWEHFDIHGETPFEFVPRYNIAPTQPIAVVREPHKLELLRWGLKLPNPRADGFNVRVESLNAPFYRDSIDGRRCLIIAAGFYEWKIIGARGARLVRMAGWARLDSALHLHTQHVFTPRAFVPAMPLDHDYQSARVSRLDGHENQVRRCVERRKRVK